jgi:cytochrome P450
VPGALVASFWRDPLRTLERIVREHGDVAGFRFGPASEVLVSHPDLVRQVLVTEQRSFAKGRALQEARRVIGDGLLTSEGELHLRQRRLMQPLFAHRHIGAYAEAMAACADALQARWQPGEVLDVHEEMARLTLTIVGKTLFDADVEGEASEIGDALTVSLEAVNRLVYPFGPWLERLPLPSHRRFREARARLDTTVYRLIDERRAATATGGDLLSLLLAARDEEGGMSDEQVRDEAMTIFLAGHETTAVWLTWTWYLLARHPEAEARLHDELDRVLAGRLPQLGDVAQLVYAERVLREALRLYPPVWLVGRRALVGVEIAGHRVPAGAVVLASQWIVHRDPRWWPDPLRFDPDRWAGPDERPDYAFFPFGGGTRICIGEGFAWLEAKLALAAIASRWRLRLAPGHRVTTRPRITLRPGGGMPMVLERRARASG